MSTSTDMAKQALHDKLASQITAAVSHLEALKARADAKMAGVEVVKEIAEQLIKKQGMHQKLQELKKSGDERWDSAKHDLEARIADFQKSLKSIESKIKGS
jgi:hypothetical protein